MQEIDMRARVTAIDRLRIRLEEVAAERGVRFVHGLLRRFVIEAEQAARNRIARWADGTYRATAFCDSIGREPGLVRGTLAAVKKGETITFDFTGTSPENDSSYNCFPHIVAAHVAIFTFAYPFHDLPVSNGTFASFEWVVPEGSCLNASPDAAVGNSPTLCSIVISLTSLVFAKMMYGSTDRGQIGAPNGNTGTEIFFGGVNQYGVPVVDLDPSTMNNEGQGARPDMDGVHAYGFPWGHAGRSPDVEDFEDQYAFLRLFHRLRPDSGGFGKYQGGAGAETALVVHHVPNTTFLSIGKNANITVALGLFGGYPAAACPGAWWRASGIWDMMGSGQEIPASSIEMIEMAKEMGGDVLVEHPNRAARLADNGDIIMQLASGGGGYGDPLDRDPEAVVADLTASLITSWTAEHLYGVCADPETFELDVAATEAKRAAIRQQRLTAGKPWDAFQAEWSELRPVEEATRYFGSWPDGVLDAPIVRM
jgi:acetophenone carboxylase